MAEPGPLARLDQYARDVYMEGLIEWVRRWDEGYEKLLRLREQAEKDAQRRPRARRS